MRPKRTIIVAIIFAALASKASYCDSAKQPDTLFYEVKMKCPLGDMGTRRMYVKGSNFVFEVDSPGFKTKFIKNSDGSFLMHPTRPYARKYPAGSSVEHPTVFLAGPYGDVKAFLKANNAVKTGRDKVGARFCDVYKYTEKWTLLKCQLWVDARTGVPVKLVATGLKKSDTTTATYISYKRGCAVDDSRFQLPKGTTIRPLKVAGAGAGAPRSSGKGTGSATGDKPGNQ